jgi:hypothetical protein
VRLRHCDGKDNYLHLTGVKDVENIYFDKTACQRLNSVSRIIKLIKRTVANETFVTNFPFKGQ